jgi:hypothetical protein
MAAPPSLPILHMPPTITSSGHQRPTRLELKLLECTEKQL